ncbi:MAG: KUP/HAK/KT family potassium transporter [Patescibacteria group bacterium]
MISSKKGRAALVLGALGVVFGDIGTSPLYALQAVFGPLGQHLAINEANVYGILSLIIWSVFLVVAVKYIGFVMRADNQGEGGIMALVALIKSSKLGSRYKGVSILLGIIGVALFYGDSAITPAISVLSAVEGLKVVAPDLNPFIVPLTLLILTTLFWVQKYGTAFIGRLFGPVMLVWFTAIALGGGWRVWQNPDILQALSPAPAIQFFAAQPLVAFIAMGAVVLAVTGAEALYADMGHFGRKPIARAWFLLVFPALILCYAGQGALILNNPTSASSSFILLFPDGLRVTMIILATLATLIASQSVISGAFSLTRQAIQLNFLPKMLVHHTSTREIGQVYLPFVNLALYTMVAILVVMFGSSAKLANAYGLAVSGTLAVDTILFIVVARALWQKSRLYVLLMLLVFSSIDILFLTSNLSKLFRGAWIPIVIAFVVFVLINSWQRGQRIVSRERRQLEGPLKTFIDTVRAKKPPITRAPGYAVYISHHPGFAPLALHATVEELHELHEKIVIVSVNITNESHVPEKNRAVFDKLEYNDGISHLTLSYGFHDSINIPRTLRLVRHLDPELSFDPDDASYFVSLSKIAITNRRNMYTWRKHLYALMARNALSPSDYYKLPTDRTIEMRSLIEL